MVYGTGLNSYYMQYLYDTAMPNSGYGYMPNTAPGLIQPQGGGVIGLKPTKTDEKGIIPIDKYSADDGKISAGSKVKNFVKGIGKFFTGMFTDENGKFSLGRTLKTALTAVGIGAVCVLTAGTAVPALLAAGGVAASGIGIAKGAVRAANATTDAEAESAWQSIGSSTTALGLSAVAAKAVAKSAPGANTARYQGAKGYVNGVKDVFKTSWESGKNSFKGIKGAWQSGYGIKGRLSAVKDNVVEQGRTFGTQVKGNFENSVRGIKSKLENETNTLENQRSVLEKRKAKAKTKTAKDALQRRIDNINKEINARNDINCTKSYEDARQIIDSKEPRINELQSKVKNGNITEAEQAELHNLVKEKEIQESVLTRKTEATNIIEKQIEAKQQKLEKLQNSENPDITKINGLKAEIERLENNIEFKTPRTLAREQKQLVAEAQTAAEKAKAQYDRVNSEHKLNEQNLANAEKNLKNAEELQEQAVQKLWDVKHELSDNMGIAESKMRAAKIAQQQAEELAINDYNYNGYGTHKSYGEATSKAIDFAKAEKEFKLAEEQFNKEVSEHIRIAEELNGKTETQRGIFNNAKDKVSDSQGRLDNAFIDNSRAQGHLENERAWQTYYNNKVAANGADVRGNAKTQAIKEIFIDAKQKPSAYWLTAEYSGRKQWYPETNLIELPQTPEELPAQQNPLTEIKPL